VTAPNNGKDLDSSIYSSLTALWNTEFPKTCPSCGRIYEDITSFRAGTASPPGGSGLIDYELAGQHQVNLLRNCSCGSTLSIACDDRRNHSPAGEKRRELFGGLLALLVTKGLDEEEARRRLKIALRSGDASVLHPAPPAGEE
jgi:hypothetical protein